MIYQPSKSSALREHGLSINIAQHNCLGSWNVFTSLFQSLAAHPVFISIIALQDPPVLKGKLPVFPGYTSFAPASAATGKPRVAFYAHRSILGSVSLLPVDLGRADVFAIDLHTPGGFFDSSQRLFRIINAYSTLDGSSTRRTVPPSVLFPTTDFPLLVLGDLNIHHHQSDPLRSFSHGE